MRKLVVFLLFLAPAAVYAAGQAAHVQVVGRDVAVWKPVGQAPISGFPVILFSHGFGGCNTQSVFLMEALAKDGYLVLAPNHQDARCGTARQAGGWYPGKMLSLRPQEPFRDVEKWNDTTYQDRAADMKAILDLLTKDKSFAGIAVDPSRIGIAGHSLGGYTALGMSGGWPSWKDGRIKAVLALSPHCSPFVAKGDLGKMKIPVMYQGGTRDLGETPVVKRTNGAYDQSSAPKYYVELDGAGHFAWTNLNKTYQDVINSYSLAFFDRYLQNSNSPDMLAELMTRHPKTVSAVRSVSTAATAAPNAN